MSDPTQDNPAPGSAFPATPPPLRPGDKVDPYTIKEQIGSGGSSVVFKAVDELLGKQVAIKQFLLTGRDNEPGLREKILTEARLHQTAAAADPERLVQVVDVVDGPHGLLLISEYISGPSLEQILAQNTVPMDVKQALGIIAATAMALDTIHEQGIVHLDLKPANILMPRAGGLKISDFGLATEINQQATPISGTVRYMAPELVQGGKVDGRADIYALGIMAYEMLAGREKFDEAFKLVLRDQRNQAIRWVKWHTNPKAQAPSLNELAPEVSPRLAEFVAKMMHKDINQRVDSAKDVLKAIKKHFAGKDVAAADTQARGSDKVADSSASPGDTSVLPSKSHGRLYAVIAAAVLVLATGIVGFYLFNQSRAERLAAIEKASTTMELAKEDYREGAYESALAKFEQVSQVPLAKDAFGRHARAGMFLAQGQLDVTAGHFEEAIRAFENAAGLGDEYNDKAQPLIDDARQASAFAETSTRIEDMIANQQFGEARKELQTWRDLAATEREQQTLRSLGAKLEDQQSRWRVKDLIREANDLTSRGQRNEAIEVLKTGPQKVAITDLLAQLEAQARSDEAVTLAEAALGRGATQEAIQYFEKALEAVPDNKLKERLTDLHSAWHLEEGLRMLAAGNTVGADQHLTESLGYRPDNQRAREALAQIESTGRRLAFIEAGDTAFARRDYDTAIKQYQNALDLGVDGPLSDKMATVRVQVLLAQSRAALAAGRIDEASEHVNQAQQLAADNPDVAAVVHEVQVRGEYVRHLKAGDEARARSSFGEAKRHYLQAKEAMDTPQVRARLDETEYDHILALAREFIAAEEYLSASAQLQIAASIRMTDEVQALRDEIEAKSPGEASPTP